MNKNDYYSKYLKYKTKYLCVKSMQIGGKLFYAEVEILYDNSIYSLIETLNIEVDNEKSNGKYSIDK